MNILVVGSGGREHALAWKMAQSPRADRIWVAPGNAGTQQDVENVDLPSNDFEQIIKFAKQNAVGLTVVGPEAPLANGLVDALEEAGIYTNKNTIPFDPGSAFNPSGIRLGTPAITTRGFKEEEMKIIGDAIASVIDNHKDTNVIKKVRSDILNVCDKFPLYDRLKV